MAYNGTRRPRLHLGILIPAIVVAPILVWAAKMLVERSEFPKATPSSRVVDIDFTVVDLATGLPIAGARIELDHVTGDISHEGPDRRLTTGPDGKVRLSEAFAAVTMRGDDGLVRGLVHFYEGDPLVQESYFLNIEALGYVKTSESFELIFPKGLRYETPGPFPSTIRLAPTVTGERR